MRRTRLQGAVAHRTQSCRSACAWLDMDPDARLGKDPVSFLLAMAPDAAQVGLLTDNWIIGGTL